MIGEIGIRQTSIPLISPRSAPNRIPQSQASGDGKDLASMAAATAQSEYWEPMDKSTLPAMIR